MTSVSAATKTDVASLVMGITLAIMLPLMVSMLVVLFVPNDMEKLISSRLMFWLELGLLTIYARKIEGQRLLIWDERSGSIWFYVKWILVLCALSIVAAILSTIPARLGINDSRAELVHWANIVVNNWWLLLFCAATSGVAEELLIRGYLQTRLQQLFKNDYLTVIVSAVIFSNLHWKYYSLRETIFAFLSGLFFSMHYQRYRNIWVLAMAHFLIAFILFVVWRNMPQLL